jgi:hypothetical protein
MLRVRLDEVGEALQACEGEVQLVVLAEQDDPVGRFLLREAERAAARLSRAASVVAVVEPRFEWPLAGEPWAAAVTSLPATVCIVRGRAVPVQRPGLARALCVPGPLPAHEIEDLARNALAGDGDGVVFDYLL